MQMTEWKGLPYIDLESTRDVDDAAAGAHC